MKTRKKSWNCWILRFPCVFCVKNLASNSCSNIYLLPFHGKIPDMQNFLGNPFFYFSRIDQCEYGLQGPRGGLHRKSTGFVANCKEISMILRRRCSGEYEHEIIIGGKISELAQKYPKKIIDQILGAYQENIYKIVELMSWRRING